MTIDVGTASGNLTTQAVQGVDKTSTPTAPGVSIRDSGTPGLDVDLSANVEAALKDLESSGLGSERLLIDAPESISSICLESSLITLRPEVIALTDFLPVIDDQGGNTAAGRMLDLQNTIRSLMVEDIGTIVSRLEEDARYRDSLAELRKEYDQVVNDTVERLRYLSKIMTVINNMKETLDLLDNDDALQSSVNILRSDRGEDSPPSGRASMLIDILDCHLDFVRDHASNFSNSRALGQVIADLDNSLEAFSPRLLGSFDADRADDESPTTLNRMPSVDERFSFDISSITSEEVVSVGRATVTSPTNPFDPTRTGTFNEFQDSLPANDLDKVKVLLTALSRELRMSAGIARMLGTELEERYQVNEPKLLSRIIGDPGVKITDDVPLAGSLSSVLRFEDDDGRIVLPFENRRVVDPDTDRTFIPGSIFLVDSILRGDDQFDTAALETYASAAHLATDGGARAISRLMNFDDGDRSLYFDTIFREVLSIIADSIRTMVTGETASEDQVLGAALLVAAQTDVSLKRLLFRYVLGIRGGDYVSTSTSDPSKDDRDVGSDTSKGSFGRKAQDVAFDGGSSMTKVGANPTTVSSASTPVVGVAETSTGAVAELSVHDVPQSIENRVTTLFGSGQSSSKGNLSAGGVTDRTFSDATSPTNRKLSSIITLKNGVITDILDSGSTNRDLIFTLLADHADRLLSTASSVAEKGLTGSGRDSERSIKTPKGLTRMNRLSDDTLLLLLFEVFTAVVSKFVPASFMTSTDSGDMRVSVDKSRLTSTWNKMMILAGRQSSAAGRLVGASDSSVSSDRMDTVTLQSILESLVTEDALIRDLVDIIQAVGRSVRDMSNDTVSFFSSPPDSDTGTMLAELLATESDRRIIQNLSDAQVTIAWQAYQDLLLTTDRSLLPDDQVVTEAEFNALQGLLNEPEYVEPSGENLRILTVGLPTGLLSALQRPTFRVGEDTTLESESADLITVKVYRVDPEFEDLVFKPRSFLFDASRFAQVPTTISAETSFDQVLSKFAQLRNVTSEGGIGSQDTLTTIRRSSEYSNLSQAEIDGLFRNHMVSDLLRLYIKMMTGMLLSEHSFLSDESSLEVNVTDGIVEFMRTFLTGGVAGACSDQSNNASVQDLAERISAGLPIELAITEPSLIQTSQTIVAASRGHGVNVPEISSACEESQEDVDRGGADQTMDDELLNRFKRLISTIFFRKEVQRARTLQPKLFERVFLVPIDPDDFEIDVSTTTASRSGKALWKSNALRGSLIEEGDQYGDAVSRLERRDGEFSELFVVVSLGVDL